METDSEKEKQTDRHTRQPRINITMQYRPRPLVIIMLDQTYPGRQRGGGGIWLGYPPSRPDLARGERVRSLGLGTLPPPPPSLQTTPSQGRG